MKIILASKSGVRKNILTKNKIECEVCPSNIDEEEIKNSLINELETEEGIGTVFQKNELEY